MRIKLRRVLHDSMVHSRRVRVLQTHLLSLLPDNATVLDVGCGDGLLAKQLSDGKSRITIQGIDVVVRPETYVPVAAFDGVRIPFDDRSIDVVMFVDVLHHTEHPLTLLKEAKRVAREAILIKDHLRKGILAQGTLRFMDWVGNAHHGVMLPYNYWSESEWHNAFHSLNLTIEQWTSSLKLYPLVADWVFGRSLHFVALLRGPDWP